MAIRDDIAGAVENIFGAFEDITSTLTVTNRVSAGGHIPSQEGTENEPVSTTWDVQCMVLGLKYETDSDGNKSEMQTILIQQSALGTNEINQGDTVTLNGDSYEIGKVKFDPTRSILTVSLMVAGE